MEPKYCFSSKECTRREHQLWAHAVSDDELQVARPKVIIETFEKAYMVEYRWDPQQRRNLQVGRRLLGFRGMRLWGNGTLHFSVRSPEISFFGAEASRLCPDVPIMYRSIADNRGTPFRFFVGGREFTRAEIPLMHREKFTKLEEVRSGFIPGRVTLDAYLFG